MKPNLTQKENPLANCQNSLKVTSSLDDEKESNKQSQTRWFTWFDNLPMSTGRGKVFITLRRGLQELFFSLEDLSHKSTSFSSRNLLHFFFESNTLSRGAYIDLSVRGYIQTFHTFQLNIFNLILPIPIILHVISFLIRTVPPLQSLQVQNQLLFGHM